MTIPSPADDSATSKCIECGAAISSKAKFCERCGALQTTSPTSSPEQVGDELPQSAATGIESQASANPLLASATTNQTSNPAEAGSVDERASTQKKLFMICGIAAVLVLIVLACIGWFESHPISAKAQYELGVKYATGKGVQQDDAQAVYWYRKAAEHGDADAQNNLGVAYENGQGGLAKDGAQAVFWYQKAADQGEAAAQSNLGAMYYNGLGGLAKDEAEAVRWISKAAEQGNADGQRNLANMYNEGRGVVKDDAEAVRWWRKAAEQGDAESQYNLGVMYENGRGGLAEDDAQAVSWYQKAAEQGNADAKVNLANIRARQQQEQSSGSVPSEPSANRNPRAMTCNTVGWSGGMKPAELTDGRSLEVKIVPIRSSADQLVASLIAVGPFRVENYEPVMPKEVIWKANFVNEKPDWPSGSWIAKSGTIELGSMNFVYEDESSYRLTVNPPNAMPKTLLGKCYDENEK